MDNYNFFCDWLMRLRHPLAGLNTTPQRWASRTVVAARHYPHLLCWSWFLERHDELPKRKVFFFRYGAGGHLGVGRWELHWQHYRMPALRTIPE
jgi:hypothetical protein